MRLAESPDLAYALPTSWAVCFVIGAAARIHRDRPLLRFLPSYAVPAALAGLAVLSVIPLRGHALIYLAGGPAIATLTAVLLLSWRTWIGPLAAALTLLVAGVSWRLVEKPLSRRPSAVAV